MPGVRAPTDPLAHRSCWIWTNRESCATGDSGVAEDGLSQNRWPMGGDSESRSLAGGALCRVPCQVARSGMYPLVVLNSTMMRFCSSICTAGCMKNRCGSSSLRSAICTSKGTMLWKRTAIRLSDWERTSCSKNKRVFNKLQISIAPDSHDATPTLRAQGRLETAEEHLRQAIPIFEIAKPEGAEILRWRELLDEFLQEQGRKS